MPTETIHIKEIRQDIVSIILEECGAVRIQADNGNTAFVPIEVPAE